MNADRYVCCDEQRRGLLAKATVPANVSGIDYIVVNAGATTADPTTIEIVLVKPLALPAAQLDGGNIAITGGVRFAPPKVLPTVGTVPGGGSVERYVVTIPGGQLTDFSTYRLALIKDASSDDPPAFIDPRLSAVDFSFKIGCKSDFDCAPVCEDAGDELPPDPNFDYRARDYQGFRRQILDRLAELVPGFKEDDPVDFTTTLAEIAAYRADQQSYRLDWVGTEAFLSTARSRASITRHARLVDYVPGEGVSARVFARFTFKFKSGGVADGTVLNKGTPLLVRSEGLAPVISGRDDYRAALSRNPIVFETMAPLAVWDNRNTITFHTWGDDECRLLKGATAATLKHSATDPGALAAGDFLLLAETVSPETCKHQDARRDRRHVVRLTRVTPAADLLIPGPLVTVEWAEADALPFDLVIQMRPANAVGASAAIVCAEAAGNIMLADHGASLPPDSNLQLVSADTEALRPKLSPPLPIDDEPWKPVLDRAEVSRAEELDFNADPQLPAAWLAHPDATRCLPALWLDDDFDIWTARRDLLESGRFDRDFVIETGIDGRALFRFGDGTNGLPPSPGTQLIPRGRFGMGPQGNIGTGALAHVVVQQSWIGADLQVTNPLPAHGGASPESISAIRIAAPQAFRHLERAVTAADYAEMAMRHPQVANAMAVARWTGAWRTVLVYVDRTGGLPVDKQFRRELLAHIEQYRLMGFDVAVRGAVLVPLEIELFVCARPGELRSTVAARVREALRPTGSGGVRGFFHPDNFTFGSALYLSQLIAAVMAVEGVQSVTPRKFQRFGRLAQGEIAAGIIRPGNFEVFQLDDNPSFPERGRLTLSMGGGR